MTPEEKRDKQREYSRRWYQRNKEKLEQKRKTDYEANPEKVEKARKKALEYYYTHREECIAKTHARRRKFRQTPEGKEQMRRERIKRKRYHRDCILRSKYGITLEEYEELAAYQDHVCAICKKPDTHMNRWGHTNNNLSIDHCHKTGKIRGLLCKRCNTSIGKFEDSPDLLRNAAKYLEENG